MPVSSSEAVRVSRLSLALMVTRGATFVSLVAGLWLYYSGFPMPSTVVWILAVSTALAIVGVLLLLEHAPVEVAEGTVTSKGRR